MSFVLNVSLIVINKRCLCCTPELKANEMEILEKSLHKNKTTKC